MKFVTFAKKSERCCSEESTSSSEKIQTATPVVEIPTISITPPEPVQQPRPAAAVQQKPAAPKPSGPKVKTPIEEFIGTNLLNKLGIAAVVLGLGIGAKYAIDNDMINYLGRSVLGYLSGLILIGLAIRLKPKHAAFSACTPEWWYGGVVFHDGMSRMPTTSSFPKRSHLY